MKCLHSFCNLITLDNVTFNLVIIASDFKKGKSVEMRRKALGNKYFIWF